MVLNLGFTMELVGKFYWYLMFNSHPQSQSLLLFQTAAWALGLHSQTQQWSLPNVTACLLSYSWSQTASTPSTSHSELLTDSKVMMMMMMKKIIVTGNIYFVIIYFVIVCQVLICLTLMKNLWGKMLLLFLLYIWETELKWLA